MGVHHIKIWLTKNVEGSSSVRKEKAKVQKSLTR